MNRIVLAYSGGFVTSAAIPWLAARHDAEIVTVTLDVGQARELAAVREQALALGATRAHVLDVREEFVRDFVMPALEAGLFSQGQLGLTTTLALPLVARRLADLARMEAAGAVAVGGRNAIAVKGALAAMAPGLAVISLLDDPDFADQDLAAFAGRHGVPVPPPGRPHVDATLWGRVVHFAPGMDREDAFILTRSPHESPPAPAVVDIDFEAGVPVRTNGVEMSLPEMIESLETIAGAHAVGRDEIEPDDAPVAEAPAALVLQTARRVLETAACGEDLAELKRQLSIVYRDLLVTGRWFSDVREAIDAFAALLRPRVTGRVRIQLLRGRCTVLETTPASGTNRSVPAPRAVA